jgi:hypothetical protein
VQNDIFEHPVGAMHDDELRARDRQLVVPNKATQSETVESSILDMSLNHLCSLSDCNIRSHGLKKFVGCCFCSCACWLVRRTAVSGVWHAFEMSATWCGRVTPDAVAKFTF